MGKRKETTNAVEILRRRYIEGKPEREASLQTERINAQVASMIYELRKEAGLNQGELAELVGTAQSAISRLEDADYEGHSLSMLGRIARALNQRLMVLMTADDEEIGTVRYVFRVIMQDLRRKYRLSIDELAQKLDIDREEVIAMERNYGYRPSPLTLHKLSEFYGIPHRQLAALAGAIKDLPDEFQEHVSRFAAQSESFAKLTKEEKKVLDEFVGFLRSDAQAASNG